MGGKQDRYVYDVKHACILAAPVRFELDLFLPFYSPRISREPTTSIVRTPSSSCVHALS